MKNTAEIISLLFFLGALLPPFLGLYMIRLDSKLIINRIFLLSSLALSVWLLGFAMANSQSTVEVALLPGFPATHNETGGRISIAAYSSFCFSRISPTLTA